MASTRLRLFASTLVASAFAASNAAAKDVIYPRPLKCSVTPVNNQSNLQLDAFCEWWHGRIVKMQKQNSYLGLLPNIGWEGSMRPLEMILHSTSKSSQGDEKYNCLQVSEEVAVCLGLGVYNNGKPVIID